MRRAYSKDLERLKQLLESRKVEGGQRSG
jgi:hypothetical protein